MLETSSVLCDFSYTGQACPHELRDESLQDALVTKDAILFNGL